MLKPSDNDKWNRFMNEDHEYIITADIQSIDISEEDPRTYYETYSEENFTSCLTITSGTTTDDKLIGNCISGQLEFSLIPKEGIRIIRMAKIIPYVQCKIDGEAPTERLQKGLYFVDERTTDISNGELTIKAFDSMLKAERTYFPIGSTWESKTINEVVLDICSDMRVELDERIYDYDCYGSICDLVLGFPSVSTDSDSSYSDREILGYIGVIAGGNWIINDDEELSFVPLKSINEETHDIAYDQENCILSDIYDSIRRVIVKTSENSVVYVWRDRDTGNYDSSNVKPDDWDDENISDVMEVSFPLVFSDEDDMYTAFENCLRSIYNYGHTGVNITNAFLDMRAEFIDDISVISDVEAETRDFRFLNKTLYLDPLGTCDISNPYTNEVDHEYPYESSSAREITRTFEAIESHFTVEIGKVESAISAKTNIYRGEYEDLPATSKLVIHDLWYNTKTRTESGTTYEKDKWYQWNGESWEDANGELDIAPPFDEKTTYNTGDYVTYNKKWYRCKKNNVKGVWDPDDWEVANYIAGSGSSIIKQTFDNITLAVTSDYDDGTTIDIKLNGISIASKTVDMEVQAVNVHGTLNADVIYTGELSADQLSSGSIDADYVDVNGLLTLSYGSRGIYAGAIGYGDFIHDGTYSWDENDVVGLVAGGILVLCGGSKKYVRIQNYLAGDTSFRPDRKENPFSLGMSDYRWANIYLQTSSITLSDKDSKNSIDYDLSRYDELFNSLKPASFKFKDGNSNRTHLGLISQDVEDSMNDQNMSSLDFAGFCKDQKTEMVDNEEMIIDGEYIYSLRYEEFIPLCIYEIQKLKKELEELKNGRS